ncbi:flagellar biosynthesis protein FlhF [Kineococcus sp. SYSU DK003]|uniref:hypothetical protein n=1 Tax=Kineococcus sp. SYSU DK003 TaxID=3383124 RepID=UPI003D7D66C5
MAGDDTQHASPPLPEVTAGPALANPTVGPADASVAPGVEPSPESGVESRQARTPGAAPAKVIDLTRRPPRLGAHPQSPPAGPALWTQAPPDRPLDGEDAGTDVAPEQAALLLQQAGLVPVRRSPGPEGGWLCRCVACGRESSPTLREVLRGGPGCRFCAVRDVDPDAASRIVRALGLVPLEPFPGNDAPWRCRCGTCGRVVAPRYKLVRARRITCRHRDVV